MTSWTSPGILHSVTQGIPIPVRVGVGMQLPTPTEMFSFAYTPVVCRLGAGAVFCGLAFCGIIVVGGWIIVISWFGGLVADCSRTVPVVEEKEEEVQKVIIMWWWHFPLALTHSLTHSLTLSRCERVISKYVTCVMHSLAVPFSYSTLTLVAS